MPYPATAIAADAAKQANLQHKAAFQKDADESTRQPAIDFVAKAHGFNMDYTKSLTYDKGLDQPGQNIAGVIRIGPLAFEQDLEWLSGIVFHELVHSPQYQYYASKGITHVDSTRSDPERRMIGLDEYEAYTWTVIRSVELGLSEKQKQFITHRAGLALIDLEDDPKPKLLAKRRHFDAARDELIDEYNALPQGGRSSMVHRGTFACYA